MQQSIGIIIKNYFPKKNKLIVLDKNNGVFAGIFRKNSNLMVGTIVSYDYFCSNGLFFMQNIELLKMPFNIVKKDILFFHHVLELCYHFVPIGSCAPEIFTLFYYLYSTTYRFNSSWSKKMFLIKFFLTLGMYPEDKQFNVSYFNQFSRESIDTLLSESLDLKFERKINKWLKRCVLLHPSAHEFKTIHFLYDNRTS